MYFLPKWDKFLIDRVNELSDNKILSFKYND